MSEAAGRTGETSETSETGETSEYDVIVIGAGPAGENAADFAVRDSERTAVLVESERVGGECSYWACIPSKALLRPLDVVGAAQHLPGVDPQPGLDRDGLLGRRDTWVSGYDDSAQAEWAQGAGIDVVRGHGRLTGERTVEVRGADGGTRTLRARQAVVLATGSTPTVPDALAGAHPWSSRDVTGVREVPPRLVIVGGGVVACEAARWMAALGSRVTMLVRGDALLARAEPFAGELVADSLRAAGVDVRLAAKASSATREGGSGEHETGRPRGGVVRLELEGGETLETDELLVATGRHPATDGLGLDAVGVPEDLGGHTYGGPLPSWLYAVGDVTGGPPLTHWGKYQARWVGRRIAARAEGRTPPEPLSDAPVPQVVFTEPQVAWVGRTAAQAEQEGIATDLREVDYASTAGAMLLRDDAAGRARLILERDTGRLLGATFVGPEVGELLHSATVAITGRLDVDTLVHAVPSFPTASEVWLRLLDP